jgi:hypothetical protein
MTFFFLDQLNLWKFSVWACFEGPLKNPTKIWGANPPLGRTTSEISLRAFENFLEVLFSFFIVDHQLLEK